MSLLTIIQGAADEVSVTRPSTVVASTDPEVQTLLRLSNKVGLRLMKIFPWQALVAEHTFTALGQEEQTAILPSAFNRFVSESFWNRTTVKLVSGPSSPVEWQGFKANSYSDANNPKFRYRGNTVYLLPAPTAGDTLAFEYVSKNWCESSGGTGQTAWAADTDVGVLDEELLTLGLIYEYLQGEGQPSVEAARHYEDCFNTLIDNDQPNAQILVAGDIFEGFRHFSGTPAVSGSGSIV